MVLSKVLNETNCERWQVPDVSGMQKKEKIHSEEELQRIRDEAKQQGFEKGYQEGLQIGKSEIEALQTQIKQTLEMLTQPMNFVTEQVEAELAKLVTTVCQQILRKEYQNDAEALVKVIHEAKQHIIPSTQYRLYVSSAQHELIKPFFTEDKNYFLVQEDNRLEPGDFRIETEAAQLDGSLTERIQQLLNGSCEK